MRKLAIITAAAVGSAGLALSATGAGAALHRANPERFCEEILEGGDVNFDPDTVDEGTDEIADLFRDAGKFAPKKVKKAMRRLANVYDDLDSLDPDEFGDAFTNRRFIKDSTIYSEYFVESCLGTDIDVPDLPELPELPGE